LSTYLRFARGIRSSHLSLAFGLGLELAVAPLRRHCDSISVIAWIM
jgi:hypothetical protein